MFSYNYDGITEVYNQAKELTIDALFAEGHISKEVADQFKTEYAIVLHKNSWFGKLWVKLKGKDSDNAYTITVMKTLVVQSVPSAKKGKKKNESTADSTNDTSSDSSETSSDMARFKAVE
jgi:hypothetical protein